MNGELNMVLPQQSPKAVFSVGPFMVYHLTVIVDDVGREAVALLVPDQAIQYVITELEGVGIVVSRYGMEQRLSPAGVPGWHATSHLGSEYYESHDAAVVSAMREAKNVDSVH